MKMAENQLTVAQYVQQIATTANTQIKKLVTEQQLNLPQNYSAGNAIKRLQLKIQDDDKLLACTQASLFKVMLDSAVLGLNISKNQFYVIPYGDKAQISVSYLGKVAIAKRIDPTIEDIIGKPIKQGEIFEFDDLDNGYSKIIKHKRTIESMNSKNYVGGYATILYNDGKEPKSLIMTYDRIKESWKMSQAKPINDKGEVKTGSVHDRFADDMIAKTCISAICKGIISKSDDSDLFNETVQAVDIQEKKIIADKEAEENNSTGEFIDVDYVKVENCINPTTGEISNVDF